MVDFVNTFLDFFGWNYEMVTVLDLVNNLVRLGVGSAFFVFLLNYPAKFIGRRRMF